MSRLAKKLIPFPKTVEIKTIDGGALHIKGPKGSLNLSLTKGLKAAVSDQTVLIDRDEKLQPSKAIHGLYSALLKNAIHGVSEGFIVRLTIIGVGYRAAVSGSQLDLQLGYSHPTKLEIPAGIEVTVEKNTLISIKGSDKHLVGQFAAAIRAKRPPEPYKGKGIRYENEYVRKKEGKASKGK